MEPNISITIRLLNMQQYEYVTPHLIADKTIKSHVRVGEYTIQMPPSPDIKKYINYGLPEKVQKFKKTELPNNLRQLPKEERDKIIAGEFKKRWNGVWVLVNGYPMWITGLHYTYLNYWTMETGETPDFCIHDVLWFYWWHMIVEDERCYGGYDIKPRRVGDTEKALFVLYEYASRVRNVRCGMQNKTGDDAFDNYMRLINGHQHMIWFFKPINQGTTEPKKGLKFRLPERKITAKGLSEEEKEDLNIFDDVDNVRALNSLIDFKNSIAKAYDGKRRERYHLDEVGKMEEKDMNPLEAWGFVKPTMHLHNGKKIIGKAIITTTVEEIKTGESLEYASTFWDESDPSELNENGCTTSGLKRIFRDAVTCGAYDEFGLPTIEANITQIENDISDLIKKGKLAKAIEARRKMPRTIEDALTPSVETCKFNAAGIAKKMYDIKNYTDSKTRRGDFVWENGVFGGNVRWIDTPAGDFEVSFLFTDPVEANRKIHYNDSSYGPGNYHRFCMGVDPYDHDDTNDNRKSKGGVAIFMKRDFTADGGIDLDNEEDIANMKSNRFICVYCIRKDRADLLYEDALKAAIYYGCEVFVETNKPGLRNFFKNKGFGRYLMFRPDDTKTSNNSKKKEIGAASTTGLIDQYIEAIETYAASFVCLVEHMELLEDWRSFSKAKRTKYDLTVASGFALLGATKRYSRNPDAQDDDKVNSHWFRGYDLVTNEIRKTA